MMDERISLGHYFRRTVTQKQKEGEGINPVQFSPGLWLPTTTNTPQNIPERLNINLKTPIKTALSRRQQGFEFPTGCQPTTEAQIQKQARVLNRLGVIFFVYIAVLF